MAILPQHITGLVLAGGRGSRMGGVDKGLQAYRGQPLALHALQRLRPQVGALLLNANRNAEAYAALGEPYGAAVCADALPDHPGPLAGFLAGLGACATPWLLTVPCDTPNFPTDLAQRLAQAAHAAGADLALAATRGDDGRVLTQPVFCLLRASLAGSLQQFLASGQRKVQAWTALHPRVVVAFDDAHAFDNANTLDELQRLQGGHGGKTLKL